MYIRILFVLILTVFSWLPTDAEEHLHVVILGDSNTWIGGDDCNQPQGWNKWFNDVFQPASCKSYARSGATWTNTSETRRNTQENIEILGDDNVIYNQICRLQEAIDSGVQPRPQLILIMAGTNDAWFQKARPLVFAKTANEAFATDTDTLMARPVCQIQTLAESVRYGCERLKATWPEARIILLTPLQSVAAGPANITKAGDFIEACGQLLGISVIRLDKNGGIDATQEKRQHRLTTDGTHTSELGARQIGRFLAKEITVLLQPTT